MRMVINEESDCVTILKAQADRLLETAKVIKEKMDEGKIKELYNSQVLSDAARSSDALHRNVEEFLNCFQE